MPHSRLDRVRIEVFVASWEFECCVPPPVVGEESTWTLQFVAAGSDPSEIDTERDWYVERRGDTTCVVDGPVVAYWSDHPGAPPAPRPGRALLRGHLYGNAHGPQPDGIPETTAVVERIRVASEAFVLQEDRELRRVPGTLSLVDVRHGPQRFSFGDRPYTDRVAQVEETGVLLDLAVPRR